MPLYEYRCDDCAELFEVLQSLGEDGAGVNCPTCDSDQIDRQLSIFAGMTSSSSDGAEACAQSGCDSPFT